MSRRGLALPSAMFALVAMSVLVVGLFTFTDLGAKAARNREHAARAVQLADAGLAHVVGTLRGPLRVNHFSRILLGSDGLAGTEDDTLLVGWGLPVSDEIPAGGKTMQGGTYYVSVRDDPADGDALPVTDLNGRVLVRCRAVTTAGAVAEIETIVGAIPFPGFAANGDVHFSGTPQIRGACGGAHANGDLSAGSQTTLETQASATENVSGGFRLPDGRPAPQLSNQPPVDIPNLNPMEHCVGADYLLRADGFIVVAATGDVLDAQSDPVFGWKRSSGPPEVKWDLSGNSSQDGTYCVEGNAYVSGNTGTDAVPRKMSIVATGSIEVSGNPFLTADHEDGIVLLAGGDVSISGNPAGGAERYSGLIYGAAQCKLSGNPLIGGSVVCANGPQPPGSVNIVSQHDLSGNFTIRFDCSASVFNKRRVLYWYPKLGA